MDGVTNISSARYNVNEEGTNTSIQATIDGQDVSVPLSDDGNRHYAEILRQVAANELVILEA